MIARGWSARTGVLENRIAPVPQGDRKAQALFVIRDVPETVLPSLVGARTRLVVGDAVPGVAAMAVVFANRPLTRSAVCGCCSRRGFYVRGLHSRRLPVRRSDQRPGVQRVCPELPGGTRRHGRDGGLGGSHLLHLSKRQRAWRQHSRLFTVGQFGGGENGSVDRFVRHRTLWGADLPKPSVIVMAYTGHSDLGANEPPTSVVVGERDRIAPPSVMETRVAALRKRGYDWSLRGGARSNPKSNSSSRGRPRTHGVRVKLY